MNIPYGDGIKLLLIAACLLFGAWHSIPGFVPRGQAPTLMPWLLLSAAMALGLIGLARIVREYNQHH